jgi:dienelactone hydrolase
MKALLHSLFLLALSGCATAPRQTHFADPWNLPALKAVPAATWGAKTGPVQQVWYEGEPFQGKPTRIFAYVGRPEKGTGPFPAMVLVHGGGGKAFQDWATHWAKRGYVALAMDLSGNGPNGRLPDGGPDQSDQTKFRNFTGAETKDMWTYHAVAAVLRGHSLLAAQPEVDPRRIGITGISWGGYLTCIVAGLDDRLKVAVPVYGCGFLHENSCWKDKSLAAMNAEARERWIKYFDPSQYLGGVNCPILFLNGSNDFAYPMDSYRKSYELVRPHLRTVSMKIRLKHGHYWEFAEVDSFVDSVLLGGKPLAKLQPMQIIGATATARVDSPVPLKKAELQYTTDAGEWQKREWKTTDAELNAGKISARLPAERPLVCYLSVTDERDVQVSTAHAELPVSK